MALLSTLIDEEEAGRCRIRRSENLKGLEIGADIQFRQIRRDCCDPRRSVADASTVNRPYSLRTSTRKMRRRAVTTIGRRVVSKDAIAIAT